MSEANDIQYPRKAWYTSKTLWFNTIVAGLAALEASAAMIQPYVAGDLYGYGLLILTVGNVALRIITTQGLKL